MASKGFKIVIAGGSIAGLTLANMLERLGIDFVVLEAYPEIAPQVGASIGLIPNGLRILDQIGCYDDIRALIDRPIDLAYLRGPDGKALGEYQGGSTHIINRHGYPIIFVDRQMVLQVLYNNLKDKSKVRVNKRVVKVDLLPSGVKVDTQDGEVIAGDILVGADGIHSTVRSEMWRLADQLEPGYIPRSEASAVPCDYKCIFGISISKVIGPRTSHNIVNEHFSYLILAGPSGRVYWFLFVNMGKTHYGKDIPRYTKKDEEELANEHWHDGITESCTFGDLYKDRISSVLTALPEYAFTKWHFKRIMTIGDAAHKFEPLTGQGGNSAIETAATLVSNLVRMVKQHPGGLSEADISSVFAETQRVRMPRVQELIKASHERQKVEAMETPLAKFLVTKVAPRLGLEGRLDMWSKAIIPATRLEVVDVPVRPHTVPYEDELPSRPHGRTWLPAIVAAAAFGLILSVSQAAFQLPAVAGQGSFAGHTLKESYTGVPSIDFVLKFLGLAFSEGTAGGDPNQRMQCAYFMAALLPVALIWTVEAYRHGSTNSLISLPVLFGVGFQLKGIGRIAPLYYLVSLHTTRYETYARTSGRAIPSSVAKALLPALCVGYVIPTALMFVPFEDLAVKQTIVAFWQPFPVYVAGLTWAAAKLIGRIDGRQPLEAQLYQQEDVAPLQAAYAFAFFATATAHICSVFCIWAETSLSAAQVFWAVPLPLGVSRLVDFSHVWFVFFKYDMLLYFAAVLVWCLYTMYELRRLGYITSQQAVTSAVAIAAGQFVLGPGATYVGAWWWREAVIARLSRSRQ